MTTFLPTKTFDHQTLDYRVVLNALVAFHDFIATPVGGFQATPGITGR